MQPQAHKTSRPSSNAPNESKQLAAVATIAANGYLFGYPLVLMDVTRQVMTTTDAPGAIKAPKNQFNVITTFPDPTFTDVVSPNVDTLYSSCWLDLREEPIVLSLPDTADRYYLMPILDAWTNVFASPGTRTTGNRAGRYAIVGPDWKGELPAGVQVLRSPTAMAWMIGRTQTNGRADCAAVVALKAKYKLTPLSALGDDYQPPSHVPVDPTTDVKTPPVEQVAKLSAAEFFARLARLMQDNPAAPADAPMLERLARIGVQPGVGFDPSKLAPNMAQAVDRGVAAARAGLRASAKERSGTPVNGWDIAPNCGRYNTDYAFRALVAMIGLGANLPEDAIYPHAIADSDGEPLTGAQRYRVRFAKGQLPPVEAFWSLTLYDSRRCLVDNPVDRYALGDRDAVSYAPDGSLTIYVQHDSPGDDLETNWLPAPADAFNLVLRLYEPRGEILDGEWQPPAIERVKR